MKELISKGYLKPFIKNNFYISALLIEEIKPKPLPFEKARVYVLKNLLNIKTKEALINEAKNMLKNFKGKNIGFVTKYDANKIKMLKPEEATEFLFNLFLSDKPEGFFLIPSQNPQKAVVYKIKEQKLLDKIKFKENKTQVEIFNRESNKFSGHGRFNKRINAKIPYKKLCKIKESNWQYLL